MKLKKGLMGMAFAMSLLLGAGPARAGVPVIDVANLVSAIQQVLAWYQQAQDMINQYQQLRAQYEQMRSMTERLEGARSLGTILNDPAISGMMPADMRDATQLLLNPAAYATNPNNMNQILASFGVNAPGDQATVRAFADTLGKTQQILASTQSRSNQLAQLANRVNTTADAKDSIDMVNRNVLEAASVNNQMMQSMASLEAARQGAELKRVADNQRYFSNLSSGSGTALKTYSY